MKTPLLLSVVVVLIVACTREKIIDQESTYIREPVVNCLITPEKEFSLFLNWSMQGGDANQLADTIKNALVTVYESGRKLGDITYDVTL
ncbi:MAG: hypothetical protein RIS47_1352, partial [Bacteroidota bacterium]